MEHCSLQGVKHNTVLFPESVIHKELFYSESDIRVKLFV